MDRISLECREYFQNQTRFTHILFSRAFCRLQVFGSNCDWLFVSCVSFVIGQSDRIFNTQLKTGLMAIVTLVSFCYKIVLLFTDVKKNTITHQLWESLPAPSSRLPSLTWNFCLFLISSMVWFPSNTSMVLFVYF